MKETPNKLNAKAYTMKIKSIVGQTTQDRINHRIKFKICSIMVLYSKERWITMIDTRLLEIEPVYNQGQDATTFNWRSHRQIKEGKVSSSQTVDLVFSLFYFSFLFLFRFIFLFSIFRTTRVRVDRSRRHIGHNLMA